MNISFLTEKGNKYLIFILLGVLLLVMCIPTGGTKNETNQTLSDTSETTLEMQLEQVLSAMEGVGEVEVMITTQSQVDSLFGNTSTEEQVCGVVVVAEGAGNAVVDARISEAVKALFSIEVHKISIVKMRSQEGSK